MQSHPVSRIAHLSSYPGAIAVALALAITGCSHAQPTTDLTPSGDLGPMRGAPVANTSPAPPVLHEQPAAREASATPAKISAESIYFDFDRYDLDTASTHLLARLGTVLARHSDLHVRVEGNCDERGTEEYYLLLGQRRADTAKNYLRRMGAEQSQVSTISYGKERPRATGHDETSWKHNRRDDFITDPDTVPASPVATTP